MVLKLLVDGVLTEEIDDRERVLPLLHRLDRELARRAEFYRDPELRDSGGTRNSALPGLLLNVEGLNDLLSKDDQLSQEAAILLDRFVRQGQAFDLIVKVN